MSNPPAEAPNHGTTHRRAALIVLSVLVPAIPIAAALIIGLGGTGTSSTSRFKPLSRSTPPPAQPSTQQAPPGGALVALVLHPTTMRAGPAGASIAALSTRTQFGSPEAMWVVRQAPGWLGVVSSEAGNGRIGWIPSASASLSAVSWELQVSLSARQLTVLDDGRVVQRYTVAIGAPDAPTPTGQFAVTDRLQTGDPGGPYGCCILALSAHSPHAIQGWNGGDRIAIHSTPDTGSIGLPVSHGCVRLTLEEGRWLLSHIPLGTPTIIGT